MHPARIAAKRVRYALEPIVARKLAPVRVLQTAAAAIAQLKRLQDALGALHDDLSFDHWLADRVARSSGTGTRDRAAVAAAQPDAGQPGGDARRRAPAAFVARLRRRLHQQAARRYRTLDSQPWRQRTDRLIRRAHAVADRLARKRSAADRDAMFQRRAPTGWREEHPASFPARTGTIRYHRDGVIS
jgi:hypothetical protein